MHVLLYSYELGPTGHTGGFRWDGLVRELTGRGYTFDIVTSATSQAASEGLDYGPSVTLHPVSPDWAGRQLRESLAKARHGGGGPDEGGSDDPGASPVIVPSDQPMPLRRQARDGVWSGYFAADDTVWARRAEAAGRAAAARGRPDVVIATVPEWRVPRGAIPVAESLGVPFVLDLRDPWHYGRGEHVISLDPVRRRVWRADERAASRAAALVIDGAEPSSVAAARELSREGIETPRRAVTNAAPRRAEVSPPDPDTFIIAYTGWLYPFMDPRPVLEAAGRLRARHGLGEGDLAVKFLGTGPSHQGVSFAAMGAAAGLEGMVEACGRVPKDEAQAVMDAAAVLVLIDFPHATQVPSKLYHYAQSMGRMLILGEPDGATASLARQIGVETAPFADADAHDRVLEEAYQAWRAGALTRVNDSSGRFGWDRAAEAMGAALRNTAGGAAGRTETLHVSGS